jgi:hypothetical protein
MRSTAVWDRTWCLSHSLSTRAPHNPFSGYRAIRRTPQISQCLSMVYWVYRHHKITVGHTVSKMWWIYYSRRTAKIPCMLWCWSPKVTNQFCIYSKYQITQRLYIIFLLKRTTLDGYVTDLLRLSRRNNCKSVVVTICSLRRLLMKITSHSRLLCLIYTFNQRYISTS